MSLLESSTVVAMSRKQPSPDECISRFSYRPRSILNRMISISEPAQPSGIRRDPSSSSTGLLGKLPVEISHLILGILDFKSLSRLSRASLHCKVVVESLSAYRRLIEHAPHTLAALGRTRLIGFHSANALHAALLSAHCISCKEFGAFLFLPTCQRCCYECLHRNQSLWVISTAQARKCFNLTLPQLRRIPIMQSIPGTYSVRWTISRQRQFKLVSVKAAKELGIKIHGSVQKMAETLAARRLAKVTEREFCSLLWFQDAPLQPLCRHPSMEPIGSNVPNDGFCGMASISFPSLSPRKGLENGLWCWGCEWTCRNENRLAPNVVSDLVPLGCHASKIFRGLQDRARSKTEFLEHITHCYGARELDKELDARGGMKENHNM